MKKETMALRVCLKIYSILLGFLVSLCAFIWIAFQLHVLGQTLPDQTDLLMARYLDISFGFLAFSSSLALIYGAFVESKTWITIWTVGSSTVLIGCWAWFLYRKYKNDHPESIVETEKCGVGLTFVYLATSLPVWIFYRKFLDQSSFFSKPWCSARLEGDRNRSPSFLTFPRSFCSLINFAGLPQENQTQGGCQAQQYAPVYAGSRVTVPKEEDLYNPV